MKMVSETRRYFLAVGTFLIACVLFTTSAQATCVNETCPIVGGSARLQAGNGLPVPVPALFQNAAGPAGLLSAPGNTAQGAIVPTPNATLVAGPGPTPSLMIPAGALSYFEDVFTLGLAPFDPAVLSVMTNVNPNWPGADGATFAVSGRTGGPTVTWCVGNALPQNGGGNCISPGGGNTLTSGGLPPTSSGYTRYTRTANQFGGPGNFGNTQPTSNQVALNLNALPVPGSGVFAVQPATIGLQFANGGAFGATVARAPAVASPGFFVGTWNDSGVVTNIVGPTASSMTFMGQASTDFGAPWTTGRVTLEVPALVPPEMFVISGNDQRDEDGDGFISLVSGGLADRSITGASTSRSWLTLVVPEPGMMLGLISGMLLLTGLKRSH